MRYMVIPAKAKTGRISRWPMQQAEIIAMLRNVCEDLFVLIELLVVFFIRAKFKVIKYCFNFIAKVFFPQQRFR